MGQPSSHQRHDPLPIRVAVRKQINHSEDDIHLRGIVECVITTKEIREFFVEKTVALCICSLFLPMNAQECPSLLNSPELILIVPGSSDGAVKAKEKVG